MVMNQYDRRVCTLVSWQHAPALWNYHFLQKDVQSDFINYEFGEREGEVEAKYLLLCNVVYKKMVK